MVPIEEYSSQAVPSMDRHLERVMLAESLGFSAVWLRDVPFNVASFGDAGQLFDPFVYLGYLAAHTRRIALGVASIILPLRHPVHVAKSATSIDQLSQGRLLLGVASGDRPQEYPAMNMDYDSRGQRFRDSFEYLEAVQEGYPQVSNGYGELEGDMDLLPKPFGSKIPLLITGASQQSPEWLSSHGNGWMMYPRSIEQQQVIIQEWRSRLKRAERAAQPAMQPLYFSLASELKQPQPLHLGFRSNLDYLVRYLKQLELAGVNHVALNLRFESGNVEETLHHIAEHVLPQFHDESSYQ